MPSHLSGQYIISLENMSLYQVLMGWGWVRSGIRLLLRNPDQLLLQITSVLFEVLVLSHRRQETMQNYPYCEYLWWQRYQHSLSVVEILFHQAEKLYIAYD